MKKPFILLIILLLIIAVVLGLAKLLQKDNLTSEISQSAPKTIIDAEKKEISIGQNKLLVEIADTAAKQIKGLGGRELLGENEGMIFVFSKPDFYGFWMKDMKIGLDFIWIKGDKVVDITEQVLPSDQPADLSTYRPAQIVDKVLEVNAGWVVKHGAKIGDIVSFVQ